jgi:hypothetical protein
MISATFIFQKKDYDDEFLRLDAVIEEANLRNPQFLGKDSWANPEKGLSCVVYYYQSMAGLVDLKNIAAHKEAKAGYARWYAGYQVVIAEILSSYGDGTIAHPTPGVTY